MAGFANQGNSEMHFIYGASVLSTQEVLIVISLELPIVRALEILIGDLTTIRKSHVALHCLSYYDHAFYGVFSLSRRVLSILRLWSMSSGTLCIMVNRLIVPFYSRELNHLKVIR